MLKKKSPSLEERLNAAHATAEAAVSVVSSIADDLEQAVVEKKGIISDIDFEADRLYATLDNLAKLRAEAVEAKAATLTKVNKFRALVSA